MFRSVLFIVMLLSAAFASAFEERTFATPADEALFDSLVAELRCLVCQNQNIADSDAGLAVDLRREIYTMIGDGKTKSDIIDFMVQRYGEFVLYKPRFSAKTLVLWLAPALLLFLGVFFLYQNTVSGRKSTVTQPDDAALARARRLLEEE